MYVARAESACDVFPDTAASRAMRSATAVLLSSVE
jgi:hypothetical protein